jgi:putative transposase
MAKRRYVAEEIVRVLREVEAAVAANGKTTWQACREAGITEQTYYRWRKELGAAKLIPAQRLQLLGEENSRLERLVSELSRLYHFRNLGSGNPTGNHAPYGPTVHPRRTFRPV